MRDALGRGREDAKTRAAHGTQHEGVHGRAEQVDRVGDERAGFQLHVIGGQMQPDRSMTVFVEQEQGGDGVVRRGRVEPSGQQHDALAKQP